MPELDPSKRRVTWTVYVTTPMTLTTDLDLFIRVSMFEYVTLVTGTSSVRAASGGASATELPRTTRSQPEPIRTVEEDMFFLFVFVALNIFPKFSPNPPKQPILSSPRISKLARSDREQRAVLTGQCGESGDDKINCFKEGFGENLGKMLRAIKKKYIYIYIYILRLSM